MVAPVRLHTCHYCLRPILRVQDGFCGEGGIGMGYYRAARDLGFCPTIVGTDTSSARLEVYDSMNGLVDRCGPLLPFVAVQADALEYTAIYGGDFHLNHGSPTCTGYSRGTAAIPDRAQRYDRLIATWRDVALTHDVPYVIENVNDARPELRDPLLLCGRMFGLTAEDTDGTLLTLDRHRLFETSVELRPPHHQPHGWKSNRRDGVQVAGSYGGARRDKHEARHVRRGGYVPASVDVQRALLRVPWMTEKGCQLSVPPDYSHWLGLRLMRGYGA